MLTKLRHQCTNLLIAVTFAIGGVIVSFTVHADSTSDALSAAYLYKLAQMTQWPNAGSSSKFHFHLTSKDKSVLRAMQSLAREKKLAGKSISVSHSSSSNVPDQANVIFVSSNSIALHTEIFERLEGRPILIISEGVSDKRLVMINLFRAADNTQRFEINKANILNQGLGIHPDIVLLGGTEIDVAKLYREGQQRLGQQSLHLSQLQSGIASSQDEIERLQQTTSEQQKKLQQQADALSTSTEQLNTQRATTRLQEHTIEDQAVQIADQLDRFAKLKGQIDEQEMNLQEQVRALKERESELSAQQAEIDKRSGVLKNQADEIKSQGIIISEQAVVLEEIGSALASEKQRVALASAIAAVIFLLSLSLYSSNRQKKRTNLILEERTRDLETSEDKYRTLYENAPGLMLSVDVQTRRIVECNETLLQQLGFAREEIIGTVVFDLYHPASVAAAKKVFQHFLETNEVHDAELQLAKKSGETIDVLLDVTARVDHRTGKKYTLSIWRDISDRKRLERSILDAKEEAERANRAKSVFLANMSHELRTPLNAVLGFSELIVRDPTLSEKHVESLDIINRSGRHLLELINDVLDMSKIEAGRTELELKPVNLHDLLLDIGDMMRLRAEEKQLSFLLELGADLPTGVVLDSGKVRQILINLLSNAVKFTQTGGIVLRTDAKHLKDDKWTLFFEVEDTGIGIPADYIATIFQPFEEARDSLNSTRGTGLGLAICHQFVELMDGAISVESTQGSGSVFRVEIPATMTNVDQRVGETTRKVVDTAAAVADLRILIVEDETNNRLLLAQLLGSVGFSVREAVNGEEAIQQFQQWQPHLIWMDIRMPVMDGYEATRRIRALPGGKAVKIVALTASVFKDQEGKILAAGCDTIVHKPHTEQGIFAAMREQLDLEYIYQDTHSLPAQDSPSPVELEDLEGMSDEWLDEFLSAVRLGDTEAMLTQTETLSEEFATTKIRLNHCIQEFQMQHLIDLLEEKIRVTERD